MNCIDEEERTRLQNEGTSISVQLNNTVNCSDPVPPTRVSDNTSQHNINNELGTWTEIKRNLETLLFPSNWISVITDETAMWTFWKVDFSFCIWRVVLQKNMTLYI